MMYNAVLDDARNFFRFFGWVYVQTAICSLLAAVEGTLTVERRLKVCVCSCERA